MEKRLSRKDLLKYGAFAGVAGLAMGGVSSNLFAQACGKAKPEDMSTRNQFKYVDKTAKAGQTCLNCIQYVGAAKCGTCKVVKGPIAGAGWCTIWAKK